MTQTPVPGSTPGGAGIFIPITATLSKPGGGVLAINDGPYRLADDTLSKIESKMRRVEASNPFLEGSWTVHSVRENDNIDLVVRIRAATRGDLTGHIAALRACLVQRRFQLVLDLDGYALSYTCNAADHGVEMTKPHLHAAQAVLRAQVPAIPNPL